VPSELSVADVGLALDRAVHVLVRRFAVLCAPMVVAVAIVNPLALLVEYRVSILIGVICGSIMTALVANRAAVVVVRTAASEGGGIAWRAALRYPRALLLAIPSALGSGALAITFVVVTILIWIGRSSVATSWSQTAVVISVIAALLFVPSLIFHLATVTSVFDVVLDGERPFRAFRYWFGMAWRRRTFLPAMVAGLALLIMVSAVQIALVNLRVIPPFVRSELIALPEGIAVTVGLLFCGAWREIVFERLHGRDIESLLQQPAAQSSRSTSPSTISPGTTTSQ
jgi:hypothetical protein